MKISIISKVYYYNMLSDSEYLKNFRAEKHYEYSSYLNI